MSKVQVAYWNSSRTDTPRVATASRYSDDLSLMTTMVLKTVLLCMPASWHMDLFNVTNVQAQYVLFDIKEHQLMAQEILLVAVVVGCCCNPDGLHGYVSSKSLWSRCENKQPTPSGDKHQRHLRQRVEKLAYEVQKTRMEHKKGLRFVRALPVELI